MKSSLRLSGWFANPSALNSRAAKKISLRGDEVYHIHNRGQALALEGVMGVVHVTVSNDPQDYMLRPGERLVVRKRGTVVAQGLPEGTFRLV
jgi:hypothetical protein